MGFNKAIKFGKEYRKGRDYGYGAKPKCGGLHECETCLQARLRKRGNSAKYAAEQIEEYLTNGE